MINKKLLVIGCLLVLIFVAQTVVFVKGQKETFKKNNSVIATTSQDPFYMRYGKARESVINGNYNDAITYLSESLNYAGIGIEKGMAHQVLAEIYRDIGNANMESEHWQLFQQYTMNEKLKQRAAERVRQIAMLPEKSNIETTPERYSLPPVYGRPFHNYRDVLIAQAASKQHYDDASRLQREGKYAEAATEYERAYYPDSADNAFIEYGLIQCFKRINKNSEALTLINYTLKTNSWGQENVKEFLDLRQELTTEA